jgi:acetyltransferase-like isoleucine patch superfamily enzyme
MKRWIRCAGYAPFWVRDWVFCFVHGLPWHPSWRFRGLPHVQRMRGSRLNVKIGTHFTACSRSSHNSIGVFQRVILKTNSPHAQLIMGDHVGISGCSIAATERIEIGNYVLIGSGCLITDSDAHALDPLERRRSGGYKTAPIIIEDDVFIGTRSIILKGVRIGRGSVIGAGSVVTRNIPPMVIAAGNPCQVVRAIQG